MSDKRLVVSCGHSGLQVIPPAQVDQSHRAVKMSDKITPMITMGHNCHLGGCKGEKYTPANLEIYIHFSRKLGVKTVCMVDPLVCIVLSVDRETTLS